MLGKKNPRSLPRDFQRKILHFQSSFGRWSQWVSYFLNSSQSCSFLPPSCKGSMSSFCCCEPIIGVCNFPSVSAGIQQFQANFWQTLWTPAMPGLVLDIPIYFIFGAIWWIGEMGLFLFGGETRTELRWSQDTNASDALVLALVVVPDGSVPSHKACANSWNPENDYGPGHVLTNNG